MTIAFESGEGPVGVFEPAGMPREAGEYRYLPYRSLAHLRMCESTRPGSPVTCWCEAGGARIVFVVTAVPGYGRLVVTEVRRT